MPRYYRRRYTRTIVRAPKKKWCSNMIPVDFNVNAVNEGTDEQQRYTLSWGTTLAENKTETTSPTPIVVKTGNFRAQFDLVVNTPVPGSDMTIYIVYCPEGVGPNGGFGLKEYMLKHPEWVIAWKKVDLDMYNGSISQLSNSGRITMSSRLKRNLNSGDKINVYVFSTTGVQSNTTARLSGMVQFWSCAN